MEKFFEVCLKLKVWTGQCATQTTLQRTGCYLLILTLVFEIYAVWRDRQLEIEIEKKEINKGTESHRERPNI